MFGRKKMYKKGMEDAMRAYEQLGKKQEAAKAALYNLCTPKDIKDLGDSERRMLLAILYQLADINKKQAQQIELYVSKLYNTVGAEGLCEKYGFVPEDGEVELTSNDGSSDKKYTIYYDLNTKAIRRWEDDMVLVEPRYNAEFKDTHQIGNKLLWKNVENSHAITHIVDIPSGKELLQMNELVTIYGLSDKNYCLCNEGILSVIDYDGEKERMTIPTVMKEKLELYKIGFSYNRFIVGWYINSLDEEFENSLDEDFEYGDALIAYDTITGKNFEVDCFKFDEGHIEDIYISNNLLFVILELSKNRAEDDTFYDIWCYDLEKKTYKWKQYKAFSSRWNPWNPGKTFTITEHCGKLFYYYGISPEKRAYLVIDKETGTLLQLREFYEKHGPYGFTTVIGNTFLTMCCGWADGRNFYCCYQAVDANTLSDDTDEIKEIVKKTHL